MKRFRIGVVCFLILACLLFNSCFIVIKNDVPNTVTYTVKFSTYSASTGENITAGSLINETTLAARRVQLYSELMQTTSYYETLHTESNVNMTAEEIGQALMFEPADNKGLLYVYITASKANAKALAQAIVDTATPYLETITANVVLTCVEQPSLLRNDQSCTASVMFYVRNRSLDDSSVSISSSDMVGITSLTDTCIAVLNSRHVYEEIRTASGFAFDYETYRSMLTTSIIKNTNMFEVTVTAPSEDEANTLIAAVTDILPRKIKDIAKDITLEIV